MNFVNEIPHCQYEDSLTDEFKKRGRKRIFSRFMLDSISVFNSVVGKSCCCIDVGVRSARSEFGDDVVGMIGMGVLKEFNFIFDYKEDYECRLLRLGIMPKKQDFNQEMRLCL